MAALLFPMPSPWIDISLSIESGMVHWPGDPVASVRQVKHLDRGDEYTMTAFAMSAHTGTHMDAPSHFFRGGATIDTIPPDAVVGPARVIEVRARDAIRPVHLERHRIRAGERLLFKTRNSARCWKTGRFVEDFVYISAEAAHWLAARRVRTVGVDYLSVGGFREDGAETHRTLLGAGIWLVEGLHLSQIAPGRYDMVCLPLKIGGGDGAPARVALRKRD